MLVLVMNDCSSEVDDDDILDDVRSQSSADDLLLCRAKEYKNCLVVLFTAVG